MAEKREKVVALTDRQQAREKISVFFDSRDNYYHPLREMLANATDELNANYKEGFVTITHEETDKGSQITVQDTGRGLPIGETTEAGESQLELLLETLFAGTKTGGNNAGMTGQNGLGLTVTNYNSVYFKVESTYNGITHTVIYENGGERIDYSETPASKKSHGTIFTFILDSSSFTNVHYEDDEILNIVSNVAKTAPKIFFNFIDSKGVSHAIHYKSLADYFENSVVKNQSTSKIINIDETVTDSVRDSVSTQHEETNEFEVHLTTMPVVSHEAFLNKTAFTEDSTIDRGVILGLKAFFNKNYKTKKKDILYTDKDIENAFSYVVNVTSTHPEFVGQTKFSTKKEVYRNWLKDVIMNEMTDYMNAHKPTVNRMVKHLDTIQAESNKNDKAHKRLLKQLSENVNTLTGRIDGLKDCLVHDENSELLVAEGISAGGSLEAGRNSKYQAIYPIRGKFKNIEDLTIKQILENKEARDILSAIGGGVGEDFSVENMRYHSIILSADSDSDGLQIQASLLAFFNVAMPGLIESGRVYVTQAPLYRVQLEDGSVLNWLTETERNTEEPKYRDQIIKTSRFKGLGEASPEEMRELILNPETRSMIQIQATDSMKESFRNWFSNSTIDFRKNYIDEHLHEYILES